MESRDDMPRVSVGKVQDWERLRKNYEQAAIASLEDHVLPHKSLANEHHALVAHVNQFIDRAFQMAQPNLRINGNNFVESLNDHSQNMDNFDEALDRRIWSLANTRLQWHKRLAEIRHKVPPEIESSFLESFSLQRNVDTTSETAFSVQDSEGEYSVPNTRGGEYRELSALGEELDQIIVSQQRRIERANKSTAEMRWLDS